MTSVTAVLDECADNIGGVRPVPNVEMDEISIELRLDSINHYFKDQYILLIALISVPLHLQSHERKKLRVASIKNGAVFFVQLTLIQPT